MSFRITRVTVSVFAAASLALIAAAPASATDFCLQSANTPDCPAGATIQPDLEAAMVTNGDDGFADRVFLPLGKTDTVSNFHPVGPTLDDDLTVVGVGRDQTFLTTISSGNIYVVDLNDIANRKVTMRDLTIRVPESFPDNGGAALQSNGDMFERVDFESRNPRTPGSGSGAADSIVNGGVFRDVRVFGTNGGSFQRAFGTGDTAPGKTLEISNSEVKDVRTGVAGNINPGIDPPPVFIRRSRFTSDSGAVLSLYGNDGTVENSVIEAGEFTPFFVTSPNSSPVGSNLVFRNNTLLNLGGAQTAITVSAGSTGSANATAAVTDSIIYGFPETWNLSAATGSPAGDAIFEMNYSNFENPGVQMGDSVVNTSLNQSVNPGFEGLSDYHLSPTSPSIDAGNPSSGGLIEDFEGNVRPLDGNGDGTAVRDQGAYEAPKVSTCANTPTLCPEPIDTIAPRVTKVKFKSPKRKKKGSLKLTLSENAKVTAVFKPKPKGKGKKKRKTVTLKKAGKKGANTLVIKKGKMKKGKYKLTISATDSAGNKSKTVKKTVRVK